MTFCKHAPNEQNKQNSKHQETQKTELVRTKDNKAQNDQKALTSAPRKVSNGSTGQTSQPKSELAF